MKTFKTPKGTELPIMDIKGKDYLQAAPRIVWFREERPNWGIETEFLSLSDSHAVCRATIRDENGRIIAQASSMETKQGFESFVEKAETCAVSRAASFCNFGTLMAQELEEHGKLAETPQASKSEGPGAVIVPFGDVKGTRLDALSDEQLGSIANWYAKMKEPPKGNAAAFKKEFDAFIAWKKGPAHTVVK